MGGVVQSAVASFFPISTKFTGGREEGLGLGLRSATPFDILLDEEASKVRTTDARRLSRYPFEKMLCLQEGGPLVLYFRKDIHILNDLFARDPL